MKFIWLITIFLICLKLCFCFLCCNTSLPALPAFIQCLTDSHLREQTEGFHKKQAVQAACDPTWNPGEGAAFQRGTLPASNSTSNPSPPGSHPLMEHLIHLPNHSSLVLALFSCPLITTPKQQQTNSNFITKILIPVTDVFTGRTRM